MENKLGISENNSDFLINMQFQRLLPVKTETNKSLYLLMEREFCTKDFTVIEPISFNSFRTTFHTSLKFDPDLSFCQFFPCLSKV